MNQQDFAALAAQDYNRIPVSTEVLADLETPLSAYLKLAEGAYSFFLEGKTSKFFILDIFCLDFGTWHLFMNSLNIKFIIQNLQQILIYVQLKKIIIK